MRNAILINCLLLAACATEATDSSLYLTGTEESYVTTAAGAKVCMGKKVLICHVPPGNPANAHTICVGKPAVDAHMTHHPDSLGACGAEPNPPPDDPPPVDPQGPGTGGDGTPIL